jgi:putative RNA 2'-phosphotransferase
VDDRRLVKRSKQISKQLRHRMALEPGGWVAVEALLERTGLTRDELDEVVARNDKQRFAYDASGERIRAQQGHSVPVDLQLEPVAPPPELFHGTGEGSVAAILEHGLERRGRHHVHLSPDERTATRVGARHGRPVVLRVDAAAMAADGHVFLRSGNGVWLTDAVPPRYLRVSRGPAPSGPATRRSGARSRERRRGRRPRA